MRNRRGVALYRTHVETRPRAAGVLIFGACTFRCIVLVDGTAARAEMRSITCFLISPVHVHINNNDPFPLIINAWRSF